MLHSRKPEALAVKTDTGDIIPSEFFESLANNEMALEDMEKLLPDNHISAICRFWILHFHTSYETLLYSYISSKDDISEYEPVTKNGQNHQNRLNELKKILSSYGVVPADDIFDDFNALISLRNYLAHGQWHNFKQKELVHKSSFPTNINLLNKDHLKRVKHIYNIVIQCLFNRIFVTSSTYDKKRIDEILLSININPTEFHKITDISKSHRLLFTHLGVPIDLYDSCINSKKELDLERLELLLERLPNFKTDKIVEILKCMSENIKWPS